MSSKVYPSEERDIPLLQFLWHWKVATTAALARKFFPQTALGTAYRRLWTLERGKFIRIHANSKGKKFVWGLDQKGYQLIRDSLPELREDGYRSECIGHDLLCMGMHVGEWLCAVPSGAEFFTEQQLRRYHFDVYPKWIPKTDVHRPDGYWNLPHGEQRRAVALEVELTHQKHTKYADIARFYANERSIYGIIWLVPTTAMAKSIQTCMAQALGSEPDYHSFVALPQLKRLGWSAPVACGRGEGSAVRDLLTTQPTTDLTTVSQPDLIMLNLDTRKSPHRSKRYKEFALTDFSV